MMTVTASRSDTTIQLEATWRPSTTSESQVGSPQ